MKLTIAFFASALAFASAPGLAGDLPDYGSKNFSPSGDTPTYFANEDVSVSARTADTTERDWSVVDEMAPGRPAGRSRSAYRSGARHGRYVSVHGFGRRSTAGSAAYGTRGVPIRYHAAPSGAKHGKAGARHASGATHDAVV